MTLSSKIMISQNSSMSKWLKNSHRDGDETDVIDYISKIILLSTLDEKLLDIFSSKKINYSETGHYFGKMQKY